MGGSLLSFAAAALVFAAVLLPPGYALVRLMRVEASGLPRLGIAFGLGYSAVLSLLFALRGGPGVAVAVALALASLAFLRPRLSDFEGAVSRSLPTLAVPLALAGLALLVNGRDLVPTPSGASLALGFDVFDRIFYATVAQELQRAGSGPIENPLFAGLPLQYAFFPCLAGVLVHALTGADLLALFLVGLPALGILLVALLTQALLEDWGASLRLSRVLTAALVVLGGDLSFLVAQPASVAPERFRHFFVFFSFSGECLYYNPWSLGIPLVLSALLLARRFLADGRAGHALAAMLVIGALWQTKAFACLALVAGSLLYGLLARRARPLLLAAGSVAVAAPWAALSLASGAARGESPLTPSFLYVVQAAVAGNPTLRALAVGLGVDSPHAAGRALAIGTFTALFLAGGLGLRLIGLPRLLRETRTSASGVHGLVLGTLTVLLLAGLFVEGHPTEIEGVQFLLLAQALFWLYAGPVMAEAVADGPGARRALAVTLVLLAVATPASYALRKIAPTRFTSPASADRVRAELPDGVFRACAFLAGSTAATDRVAVPFASASDPYGVRPLVVAALAGRRVVGNGVLFHVDAGTARERGGRLESLYTTTDAAVASEALDALGARWLWVDEDRPLGVLSPRLALRHAEAGVRLYEVLGS